MNEEEKNEIDELLDALKKLESTEKKGSILPNVADLIVTERLLKKFGESEINLDKLMAYGILMNMFKGSQQQQTSLSDLITTAKLLAEMTGKKENASNILAMMLQLQQQQQQQQMQMQQMLLQMLFGSKFKEYEEKTKALEERIKEMEGGMVQELIALRDELKRISEKKEMSVSDLETVLEGYKKVKQLVGELAPELGYKKELVTKEGQINVNELLNTAITIIDKALSKYFAQKPPLPAVEKIPEAPIQQETPKLPETPLETPKEEKIEIKEEIKPIVASETPSAEAETPQVEVEVKSEGETTETPSELPEESKEE